MPPAPDLSYGSHLPVVQQGSPSRAGIADLRDDLPILASRARNEMQLLNHGSKVVTATTSSPGRRWLRAIEYDAVKTALRLSKINIV
jgi:hypothetical protein